LQDVLSRVLAGDTSLELFSAYIAKTSKKVDDLTKELDTLGVKLENQDMLQHILNVWEQIKAFPVMQQNSHNEVVAVHPAANPSPPVDPNPSPNPDPGSASNPSPAADVNPAPSPAPAPDPSPAPTPTPNASLDSQEQIHELTLINTLIDKIVYHCGYLTIPSRLTDWLKLTRTGYYIPFHEVFQDEVPNANDRGRLLKFLAWSPVEIKNVYIDLNAGLVYKYSHNAFERFMSLVYLLLAFAISTGIVVWSCQANLSGWPLKPENLGTMISGWVALLVGVAVHIGIGSIKDTRKKGLPVQFAPGDIFFIVNVRLSQIVLKLFIALIGLFGLVLSSGITQSGLYSCFLVGYSLDSFVEMFGSSLSTQSASQLNALQKQLGVTQE